MLHEITTYYEQFEDVAPSIGLSRSYDGTWRSRITLYDYNNGITIDASGEAEQAHTALIAAHTRMVDKLKTGSLPQPKALTFDG